MTLNRAILKNILILCFQLFLCNILFAQTKDSIRLTKHELHWLKKLNLQPASNSFSSIVYTDNYLFQPSTIALDIYPLNMLTDEKIVLKDLSFMQIRTGNVFPNFGGYEFFGNNFIYRPDNKITFDVGFGLVKQNSVLTPWGPNYHLKFSASTEYSIASWLSVYLYGQYVTPTINHYKVFDPLIYMNTLFIQSEAGSGIRATHKNIKADFGVKTIYDATFDVAQPFNTVNSKITIGF